MTATRSDSLRRARSEGRDGYYVQLADVGRGLYSLRDHFIRPTRAPTNKETP